uniref:Uncharacterized protein n=1 Tax=Trichobilharzia regenti TaxID=157069 RepID=A0AA85INB4_TRIRE|nr:unnamed protein product [Trichobilharzia regenti]
MLSIVVISNITLQFVRHNFGKTLNMKTTETVHIDKLPFLKMILHAAKHPESPVSGLLLSDCNHDSEITITDYIPLFHTVLNLAPMLETALYHVSQPYSL